MTDICGDNRFEVIAEAKKDLLESTNIEMSSDEMSVIDNFLFRCWQMGWLRRYESYDFCDGENPCKEYDQEKHCCHRWTKVIRRTIEEVKENAKKQWIPVSEALPKDMDRVLVTIVRSDGEKRVRSGHYYKGYFMMDNGDTWNEMDKEILAWMPIPEAYQGERDGNTI